MMQYNPDRKITENIKMPIKSVMRLLKSLSSRNRMVASISSILFYLK